MGNQLCKKRVDTVDGTAHKGPKRFDRIFNKLNLKPKWKSDTNLEGKQVYPNAKTSQPKSELSKSSEWTDVPLEVPPGAKPRTIFNDNSTPTPPPRKQHSKRILDTVKKAFKSNAQPPQEEQPIVEELMVKKTINYNCPCGGDHPRHQHGNSNKSNKSNSKPITKEKKESVGQMGRKSKSPSVASLPNYNELKLSVAPSKSDLGSRDDSAISLPEDKDGNVNQNNRKSSSSERLENYLTRARSLGSVLPSIWLQMLSTQKAPLAEIESDDSLGGMDDWGGLNMIEHYTPKDSSLPRPTKKRSEAEMLADIEGLIVDDEEERPVPPARKSESLVKKIHKDVRSSNDGGTPPSTPEETFLRDKEVNADKYQERNHEEQLESVLKHFNESRKIDFNNEFLNAERAHIFQVPSSI